MCELASRIAKIDAILDVQKIGAKRRRLGVRRRVPRLQLRHVRRLAFGIVRVEGAPADGGQDRLVDRGALDKVERTVDDVPNAKDARVARRSEGTSVLGDAAERCEDKKRFVGELEC